MTMDCDFSGRCVMRASIRLFLIGLGATCMLGQAAEAPPFESMGELSTESVPIAAEASYQIALPSDKGRMLDEALFTEISPVSVPEMGLRLPKDQED